MKFTCNTKPLSDALDLGIINSNVSNYNEKSTVVQLTILENKLRINIEAASIKTQLMLSGSSEGDGQSIVFVSSLILKQLISSIESNVVTLEVTDGGLIISYNKSKFTIPKQIDAEDSEFDVPTPAADDAQWIDIDVNSWKFVKDNQMFALAMSFIHPVYTRVWVGSEGDVLVGDLTNSLFTHSKTSKLGNTCLLTDTVINLFTSLPEGSKLAKAPNGRNYLISASTDAYTYFSEFAPYYESDEGVGSYNSQIFLEKMQTPANGVTCKASIIGKFLSQAELLASSSEDTINFNIDANTLTLQDKNVESKIEVSGSSESYSEVFRLRDFKKIMSTYGDSEITISPYYLDDEITGVIIHNDSLTTIIAGVE